MTVKLLLIKSENGLETRQDYDGLPSANPAFTGTLTGGSAALTGRVDAGGEIKSDALAGTGNRPLVAGADGTIDDQDAATFRKTIGAAASDHNHFSKLEVSESTTLGSIDESAIKVTTADVTLTLSGGVDGQGWDIINPTAAFDIEIPSGTTLWKTIGRDIGPTTYDHGGGRPIRITRIDASNWTMVGSH